MFSCSTESPIDELPIETSSITLHFTVGKEVNTKATYNYTTDDEKIISNYVIAIFAKKLRIVKNSGVKKYGLSLNQLNQRMELLMCPE